MTYACENGHTDVADVLLQAGANLVCHESLLVRCPIVRTGVSFQEICSRFDPVMVFGVAILYIFIYNLFFRSTSLKGGEHP